MTRRTLSPWTLTSCCALMICATSNAAVEQPPVQSFPLEHVRLLDGPFRHAQELNRETLLQYDLDRLLAPFRKEAGLEPRAEYYPNWSGLDGHIAGHYLTAMALYTAAAGDAECQRRMNSIVQELAECQAANGDGYVGGVPNGRELWRRVKAGEPTATRQRWVPWYNLHKTFAGLRDAWVYGNNEQAKDVLIRLADWCDGLLRDYTDEQMETMMDQEYGGMNAVLADISAITGDPKYLQLARRFSHRQLLDPMSEGRDTLDNKHANTQVPKAVGFQRIAELGGDQKHADAARYFWETVVANRSLVFGGNSRREHFPSADACREFIEEREGPESCNTYNMLKLTQGLHRMNPLATYADYYERALFNHILATQHPGHGGYVYFTPVRPRHYRVYSAPNAGMWCCVGSGMENHGKYGEFIYSHRDDTLYVNLFIASELDWQSRGVRIRQETRFPDQPSTALTIHTERPTECALRIRHPQWVPAGELRFTLNGRSWAPQSEPSSYVEIRRSWSSGDRLEVSLPMHTTLEPMPNVPEYAALLRGPIVLGAQTGTEDLRGLVADDSRWGHIAHGRLLPLEKAPMLVCDDPAFIPALVTPVPDGHPLQFSARDLIQPGSFKDLVLEPFFRIHDARYMLYWRVAQPGQYRDIQAALERGERLSLLLDQRTVDRVIPGEQQPEADHQVQSERSRIGVFRDAHYRETGNGGWFSYRLRVASDTPQALRVRYWGREEGRRTFKVLVDGTELITENLVGQWSRDEFVEVEYPLPTTALQGKETVTVRFEPLPNHRAGRVFDLRTVLTEHNNE